MKTMLFVLLMLMPSDVSRVMMTTDQLPQTDPASIEITTREPARAYRELAILEVKAPQADDLPKIIDKMKKDAAKLGANAIINIDSEMMNYMIGNYMMTGTRVVGVAIVWTD